MLQMDKMVERKVWWSIIGAYVLLIYTTLGVMPEFWKLIDNLMGGKGVFLIIFLLVLGALGVLIRMVFIKKEQDAKKYILFLFFLWVYLALGKLARLPIEKVHLVEYCLLGVMVYNALKIDLDRYDWNLYICGGIFCLVIGIIDEVIQGVLPNRVFDLRDMVINIVSSLVVLMMIRFNILEQKPKSFTID